MLVMNAAMLGTLTPVAAIDGKEFNKLLTLNLIFGGLCYALLRRGWKIKA